MSAAVVGTAGRASTSGTDLEQRFGLLSTLATFTTITTNAGTAAATVRQPAVGHNPDVTRITAETATAMSAFIHRVFAPRVPIVYGSIFPGSSGGSLELQRSAAGHWHTVARASLGGGGRYSVRAPGPGSYRVVFERMAGPTVGVA